MIASTCKKSLPMLLILAVAVALSLCSFTAPAAHADTPALAAASAKTLAAAPAKGQVKAAKSTASKTITVTAAKDATASHYQFALSTSKSTKGIVKKAVSTKPSCKFTSLAEGKTFYAFVRTIATVDGKKVYGSWSQPKAVKVKTHPFVGKWTLCKMDQNGEVTGASGLERLKKIGLTVKLNMEKNRKATLNVFGDVMKGTWSAKTETKGTAIMEGEKIKVTYNAKTKRLSLSQPGAALIFKK